MNDHERSAEDRALDAEFSALPPIEPPGELTAATLGKWRAERRRHALFVRAGATLGMLAMAAATLLVVRDTPIVGVPENMVERGTSAESPPPDVRVTVRAKSGEVARFQTNRRYAAGDTLLFRVILPASATVSLRREDEVLWAGRLPAGEQDVPAGYQLEIGEGPSRFFVVVDGTPAVVYLPAVAAP